MTLPRVAAGGSVRLVIPRHSGKAGPEGLAVPAEPPRSAYLGLLGVTHFERRLAL